MQLIQGDFRTADIPDNSIDLVLVDPPYIKKFIPIYGDLGAWAAKKLKEGGSLVTYIGHYNLADYLDLLKPHLTYWWIFALKLEKVGFPMNNRKVVPRYKPLLWYIKGTKYKGKYIYDYMESKFEGKKYHKWQQSTVEAKHIIGRMTEEDEVVCDPMMGSGSTGIAAVELHRKFIGIDIDPVAYQTAIDRLEHCAICGSKLNIENINTVLEK